MAGYTARVATMIQVFEDCSTGKYQRSVVTSSVKTKATKPNQFHLEFDNGRPVINGLVTETTDGTIILENVNNKNFNQP